MPQRLVVAITGSSGAVYGVHLIKKLKQLGFESHVVVSEAGEKTLACELQLGIDYIKRIASTLYDNSNIGAAIASGSMETRGMIIAPCTIKTLAGIAGCRSDSLIFRAADVTLKEGRPLVLMVRETPLHKGHLEMMVRCADYGAVIYPPIPAFYTSPAKLEDVVEQTIDRCLQRIGIRSETLVEWGS